MSLVFDKGEPHARLEAYWSEKCKDGLWPSRRDIDPVDLPDILPHILFVEVVLECDIIRLRYGLTGNAGVQLARREVTGRWFHEMYSDEQTNVVVEVVKKAISTRLPVPYETNMWSPGRENIEVSWLACPLADNGVDIDCLVLAMEEIR